MAVRSVEELRQADPGLPVEIADRIWWVGYCVPGDPFQCHCYLIENGNDSVLIDPGSKITFDTTYKKIEKVIGFDKVRYFLCHHQDPDITAALMQIDELVKRPDARVVTHGRAHALLKHYALKMPFWRVEDHDWKLDLGGRLLQFVFTPYMHFPGAFCTFDRTERVLFSSDIFGGFTERWQLVAEDAGHFEAIRPFHEHYMPSREILESGLRRLEKLPIAMIAPQHGSIIPLHLVSTMIEKLKGLECGLYLDAKDLSDVQYLSRINRLLRDVMNTLIRYREFKDVAESLLSFVRGLLPARSLEFYARWEDDEVLYLGPRNRYRGARVVAPKFYADLLGLDVEEAKVRRVYGPETLLTEQGDTADLGMPQAVVVLPLTRPEQRSVEALAVIRLEKPAEVSEETERLLEQISVPLEVAIERERIYRHLESERRRVYETSIRDNLTGLYTRVYMHEAITRFLELHDRDPEASVALAMFDLDHFKDINDSFGHLVGDHVLQNVARVILNHIREADIAVRFGGEELAVFLVGRSAMNAETMAERIRQAVESSDYDGEIEGRSVTVSVGVAVRQQKESLELLIERADVALYKAKRDGRNRVAVADRDSRRPSSSSRLGRSSIR